MASFGLAEAVVRILGAANHLYTQPAFEMSPGGDYWRYRPGFEGRLQGPTDVRIGPLGNRLHQSTDFPALVTIAAFGDSVTLGQGVEAEMTFPALLQTSLRKADLSVAVLSFGVQGHTLEMVLAHLEDRLTQIDPEVLILAFISADLDPRRAGNRVDRFGYLTKTVFGPPSAVLDLLGMLARRSHLALLTKAAYLRSRAQRKVRFSSGSGSSIPSDARLDRFNETMAHFRSQAPSAHRIVICLDLQETELSEKIRDLMSERFPDFPYVHAPDALRGVPLRELRVPRDGHPNARAHEVYAELLEPHVVEGVRILLSKRSKHRSRTPPGQAQGK